MNRHKVVNFVSAVAITIAAVMLALIGHGELQKFAILLVFVLPGYAVMAAWFPRRLTKFPGNILFITSLSLSLTALSGLVLNATPWGLQTATFALFLGGFTLINLIVALFRGEFTVGSHRAIAITLPVHQMVMIIAAIGISVFALYLGRQGALHQNPPQFTQMWMLPGKTSHMIDMGIKNYEHETVNYKLLLKDGDSVVEVSFDLKADETWTQSFNMPGDDTREVNAYLSRTDMPHLTYRSTSLWLPHTE